MFRTAGSKIGKLIWVRETQSAEPRARPWRIVGPPSCVADDDAPLAATSAQKYRVVSPLRLLRAAAGLGGWVSRKRADWREAAQCPTSSSTELGDCAGNSSESKPAGWLPGNWEGLDEDILISFVGRMSIGGADASLPSRSGHQ